MGRGADKGGSIKKGDDMERLRDATKDQPKPDEVIVQFTTKSGNQFQMNLGPISYEEGREKARGWMNARVLIENDNDKSCGMLWSDQIDTMVVIMLSQLERAQARARLAGGR